jgi:hypothetical protein
MSAPKFDRNDLTLIEIALKETGQKYNNLFEPMVNLRLRILNAINEVEQTNGQLELLPRGGSNA